MEARARTPIRAAKHKATKADALVAVGIRQPAAGPRQGTTLAELQVAAEIGAWAQDGLFLALAIRQGNGVVTADGKFRDKIGSGGHASHGRWFMDPP